MSLDDSPLSLRNRSAHMSRRLVHWLTDADNRYWGVDERERVVMHQAVAATMQLTLFLAPTVAAIVIAVFGRDVLAPVAIAVFTPAFLAGLVVWPYQRSERLPETPRSMTPWRLLPFGLLGITPLAVVLWWQAGDRRDLAGLVERIVGPFCGLVGVALYIEYRRRHPRNDG